MIGWAYLLMDRYLQHKEKIEEIKEEKQRKENKKIKEKE